MTEITALQHTLTIRENTPRIVTCDSYTVASDTCSYNYISVTIPVTRQAPKCRPDFAVGTKSVLSAQSSVWTSRYIFNAYSSRAIDSPLFYNDMVEYWPPKVIESNVVIIYVVQNQALCNTKSAERQESFFSQLSTVEHTKLVYSFDIYCHCNTTVEQSRCL